MSFLEDLKRQAQSTSAPRECDPDVAQRNARLANLACRAALNYWTELVPQLNQITPVGTARYALDGRTVLEGLPCCNFRVAPKMLRQHDGSEHFEVVVLSWLARSGQRMRLEKDFPTDIERLRARLTQAGIQAHEAQTRHAGSGRVQATSFEFAADVTASIRLLPLHDEGKVRLIFSNLDALERIEAVFPGFAMRPNQLDDIARWIVGKPQTLLKHAFDVTRHQP